MQRSKIIWLLTVALLFGFCLSFAFTAAATPGSSADPLVSRSWVTEYVEQRCAELERQLQELKNAVANGPVDGVNIVLYIGDVTATVNGQATLLDAAPEIKGVGYTMVPLRFVSESLGYQVEWDDDTRSVTLTEGGHTLKLTIGSTAAVVDGQAYTMGYAPYIENSRTMVHIRFVAEAVDCQVDWDGTARRIDIRR